jgi:hypothetical protein
VRVSKEKRRCWVTYLNGQDPETEREFFIVTTVAGLMAPIRPVNRPREPRLGEVQLGEMIERRMIERQRLKYDKKRAGTRGSTHTRFQNLAAPEQGEERPSRELSKSCKTQSPASPDSSQSPLKPRTQWMSPFINGVRFGGPVSAAGTLTSIVLELLVPVVLPSASLLVVSVILTWFPLLILSSGIPGGGMGRQTLFESNFSLGLGNFAVLRWASSWAWRSRPRAFQD